MVTAKRPLYQANIPENLTSGQLAEEILQGHYRNHLFDMADVTKSCNRKRRTKVSHGLAPLKGVKPVRDKGGFRIDESAVLPKMRPPIPFTKITDV